MAIVKSEQQSWRSTIQILSTDPSVGNRTIVDTITRTAQRSTDDNIKGWRQRVENHQDATTSLTGTRYTCTRWPYRYDVRQLDGFKHTYMVSGKYAMFDIPTGINGALVDQAATKAKQKFAKIARDKIHSWQGGVFAGELRETAKLLASPTKRLRTQVGDLLNTAVRENGRLKKATAAVRALQQRISQLRTRAIPSVHARNQFRREMQRLLRDLRRGKAHLSQLRNLLADTWLTWSFGVKPIIQDANDACEAFRRLNNGEHFEAIHIRATEEVSALTYNYGPETFYNLSRGAGVPSYARCAMDRKDTCMYIIRADYVGQNPNSEMPLPPIFGLDLSSVAPTTWELIPWSFFVDYFTDLGSAIDAWSIRLINFAWANHTIRNRREHTIRYKRMQASNNVLASLHVAGPYLAKGTMYSVTRARDLPPMEMYRPHFRIPGYPSMKWVNVAALMSGLLAMRGK